LTPAIKTSRKLLELILFSKFKCEVLCLFVDYLNSLGSNWPQRTPTLNIEWGQIDPKVTGGLKVNFFSEWATTKTVKVYSLCFRHRSCKWHQINFKSVAHLFNVSPSALSCSNYPFLRKRYTTIRGKSNNSKIKMCLFLLLLLKYRSAGSHTHPLQGCCHGNTAVSWQRVQDNAPGDDQGDLQRRLGHQLSVRNGDARRPERFPSFSACESNQVFGQIRPFELRDIKEREKSGVDLKSVRTHCTDE